MISLTHEGFGAPSHSKVKVMYTCAVAGYSNVNFAVQSGKKGG